MKMIMTKGFKYYKSWDEKETLTIGVKPWLDGEVMIDFHYSKSFVSHVHTLAALSNIFNIGNSKNYIMDLMRGNDKLNNLSAVLQGMIFAEEWLMFDHHPDDADFMTKACVRVCNDGLASFEVNVKPYSVDSLSEDCNVVIYHHKVNSFDEIQSLSERLSSMRIMLW